MLLERKDYSLFNVLGDEKDIIERLEEEFNYKGSEYIRDVVTNVADTAVPIYYYELWDSAKDISEWIERAIEEGLTELSSDVELTKIFGVGYYLFYEELLSSNVHYACYNVLADTFNTFVSQNDIQVNTRDAEAFIERLVNESQEQDERVEVLFEKLEEFME